MQAPFRHSVALLLLCGVGGLAFGQALPPAGAAGLQVPAGVPDGQAPPPAAVAGAAGPAGVIGAQVPPLADSLARVLAVARTAALPGEIALGDAVGAPRDQVVGLAEQGPRARRRLHRPGARWLWASVTKQVTAILVMQQVEAGTLALEETVNRYLPDFPGATGGRITLRQLLQHRSGLPNPDSTPTDNTGIPAFYQSSPLQAVPAYPPLPFCGGPPASAPGAAFTYNNCDYLVLGAILERVTGRSYAQLVADRIARPAGLLSLHLAADGVPRGGASAIGYRSAGQPHPPLRVATFGAAGALTGSAEDLIRLDQALLDGRLLRPDSRAVLWAGDPALGHEALGAWSFTTPLAGCAEAVALVERRGDVAGIQVRNVIAPGLGRSLAVFTNDGTRAFGEVWQRTGLAYDLVSAAFCPPVTR